MASTVASVAAGRGGWVGIAANASAGIGRGRVRVARLIAALRHERIETHVAWSLPDRAALLESARTTPGCRCIVAAGGDGTVSDLANERPVVPITVLPVGTENLFAQHFGITGDAEAVARLILRGSARRIDLGRLEDRDFALMAGFGFDADVVSRHHRARVSQRGRMRPTHRAAYVAPVLQASWSYGFPPITARILDPGSEETLVGTSLIVFNLPRYALGLPFAPEAQEDDGWLDLVVFREPGAFRALRYLWHVFRRTHLRQPGVWHRRVRQVALSAETPVPVQLDGDPAGVLATPGTARSWTARIAPGVLDVLVPDGSGAPGQF